MTTAPSDREYFLVDAERFFTPDDLLKVPPPVWLIQDHLIEGTVSMLFGEWGTGKSFAALDMAGCVSQGLLWHGRETQQVDVLYVASEGHPAMLGRRLEAWKKLQGFPEDYKLRCMVVYADLIDMDQEGTPRELLTFAQDKLDLKPQFIIVDTLNMAVGGDESDNSVMGGFVKTLRKYTRWRFEGETEERPIHWMVVHHTGHENRLRPRGASSLPGGFDTMLGMTYLNVWAAHISGKPLPASDTSSPSRALFCLKQKDYPLFDPSYFEVTAFSTELGDAALKHKRWDDTKGEIEELTADPVEEKLIRLARDAGAEGITVKDLAEGMDMNRSTIGRRLDDLEAGADAPLERISDRPRVTRLKVKAERAAVPEAEEAVDPEAL